jgi:hypothetical protein
MSAPASAAGPQPLHDLIWQVQDLQCRVLILEQRLGDRAIDAITETVAITTAPVSGADARPHLSSNALPVIGRVLVAIAGAYVLVRSSPALARNGCGRRCPSQFPG